MEKDTPGQTSEPIRFRTGKKRKDFRQRAAAAADDDDNAVESHATPPPAPQTDVNGEPASAAAAVAPEDEGSAIQAALKLRNARKSKFRGGVGFSANGATTESEAADQQQQQQLVLRSEEDGSTASSSAAALRGIPDRFMHQTGFVVDEDDKHMLEYIESRLASRSGAAMASSSSVAAQDEARVATQKQQQAKERPQSALNGQQSTSRGKLVEVDIPLDTKSSAHGKRKADNALAAPPPPRRRRNRRGSEDIKRDELIDKFLHENRLDVYNVPTASKNSTTTTITQPGNSTSTTVTTKESADDLLAEEFKRQYMDEVAARRQRRKPAVNQHRTGAAAAQQAAAASEEVLRGPKLGGSRNSRAAIRDILLSRQEQAKKGR